MTKEQLQKTVNELLPIAITADRRTKNKGRPRVGVPEDEVQIIRALRQKTASMQGIFRAMKSKNLTKYNTYQAFNQAWLRHKANS